MSNPKFYLTDPIRENAVFFVRLMRPRISTDGRGIGLGAILGRSQPDALLHHSDQGSQYTSEQFQCLMADHGIVCSISRSGNVWDNTAMEGFFSSLKTERTEGKTYGIRDEARADVFVGYLSPMEFERQTGSA